jgi:seryl-tRNA synthetase
MLDIEELRENPEEIENRLKTREKDLDIGRIIELDDRRRELIGEVEELRHERNEESEKIGELKRQGENAEAEAIIEEMSQVSDKIDDLEDELEEVKSELQDRMAELPNLPHETVPVSDSEEDKVVLEEYGEKRNFDFEPMNHLELGERNELFRFDKASKISGARFPFYYGDGALMEMALVNFMYFFQVRENDYTPVFPPYLAKSSSYYTSGQLPKFEDDLYRIDGRGDREEDLYLNPTSESIMVNYHQDEILPEEELPEKFVAFTTCFRREAGSYGEEERGLIRTHQFNKVELFRFTRPETSYEHLNEVIEDAESILRELGLHYRKVLLPTADLAQQSSKTVDLEVWIPTQEKYYEVSSISNCEDFQARRGNIRYRPNEDLGEGKPKPEYLHTLNGSGLATSRLLVALLENNQREDGSIELPETLARHVGKEIIG